MCDVPTGAGLFDGKRWFLSEAQRLAFPTFGMTMKGGAQLTVGHVRTDPFHYASFPLGTARPFAGPMSTSSRRSGTHPSLSTRLASSKGIASSATS